MFKRWKRAKWLRGTYRDAQRVRAFKWNSNRIYRIVGADARAVRPYIRANNQLVQPFTRSLLTKTWADARAVRPYMHSSSSPYPSFYTSIQAVWVCRDARFVRPFGAEQSTCSTVYSSTVNYIAFQSQSFCTLIWVILPRNLSHFTARYG